MNVIAFWALLIVILLTTLILVLIRGYKFMDFIMHITVVAASAIGDKLFLAQLGLYYYVDYKYRFLYGLVYITLLYPSLGILFSKFMPKNRTYKGASIYIALWIAFLLVLECFIIYPFKIVVFTGWWIFPHSLIFYMVNLTLAYMYYQAVERKFG
jgi:hypothetical protein